MVVIHILAAAMAVVSLQVDVATAAIVMMVVVGENRIQWRTMAQSLEVILTVATGSMTGSKPRG